METEVADYSFVDFDGDYSPGEPAVIFLRSLPAPDGILPGDVVSAAGIPEGTSVLSVAYFRAMSGFDGSPGSALVYISQSPTASCKNANIVFKRRRAIQASEPKKAWDKPVGFNLHVESLPGKCSFCGSPSSLVIDSSLTVFVRCEGCQATSPHVRSKSDSTQIEANRVVSSWNKVRDAVIDQAKDN